MLNNNTVSLFDLFLQLIKFFILSSIKLLTLWDRIINGRMGEVHPPSGFHKHKNRIYFWPNMMKLTSNTHPDQWFVTRNSQSFKATGPVKREPITSVAMSCSCFFVCMTALRKTRSCRVELQRCWHALLWEAPRWQPVFDEQLFTTM